MTAETTVLVATARNEGPYILEWLAYHKLIGFDRFVIFSNDNTDGTDLLLQALDRAGMIKYFDNPESFIVEGMADPWAKSPQHKAYVRALREPTVKSATWGCFLDLDEFLVLRRHKHVLDFVSDYPGSDAIGINWHVFGSAGLKDFGPQLVVERFDRASSAAFTLNGVIKSVFRIASVRAQAGAHWVHLHEGKVYTNTAGVIIQKYFNPESIHLDIAKINHYAIKSRREYEMKHRRGDVNVFPTDPRYLAKYNDRFWTEHDRNEVIDRELLSFADPIKSEVTRLQALAGVSAALQEIAARWATPLP